MPDIPVVGCVNVDTFGAGCHAAHEARSHDIWTPVCHVLQVHAVNTTSQDHRFVVRIQMNLLTGETLSPFACSSCGPACSVTGCLHFYLFTQATLLQQDCPSLPGQLFLILAHAALLTCSNMPFISNLITALACNNMISASEAAHVTPTAQDLLTAWQTRFSTCHTDASGACSASALITCEQLAS